MTLSESVARLTECVLASPRGKGVVLNGPASRESLYSLRAALGQVNPPQLFEWLSLHDGERGHVGLLAGDSYLMSASEILVEYLSILNSHLAEIMDSTVQVDGPVKPLIASAGWVPFALRNGASLCIDMKPAVGGCTGQIVSIDREGLANRVLAPDLVSFFEAECQRHRSS